MSFSTDGSLDMRPSNGVLKVLKPNVQEQLEEELEIWSDLAAFVDERRECDGLPLLRSTEIFQTVRELLANEARLDLEQLHLEKAARFYADSDKIQIPVVLRYSTPRITAMERVFGSRVTDTEHLANGARKDLAGLVLKKSLWPDRSGTPSRRPSFTPTRMPETCFLRRTADWRSLTEASPDTWTRPSTGCTRTQSAREKEPQRARIVAAVLGAGRRGRGLDPRHGDRSKRLRRRAVSGQGLRHLPPSVRGSGEG
jgi:hypothetical protein